MMNEYKGELEKFGYDVNTKGFVLFADLIQDLQPLFREGKDIEEIRKLLPTYYLEQYHFVQEIGKNKYFELLKSFCNSRKVSERQKELSSKQYGQLPKAGLDDSVMFFAKYFNDLHKKEMEGKKLFIQNKNTAFIKSVKPE